VRALACLLLASVLAHAADLSKIDRKIAVAPKFTAERQFYALLVLGPEATTKVWFVADGDDLFVDRNGNGDLTDDGAPLRAKTSSQGSFIPLSRSWKLDQLAVSPRYSSIEVSVHFLNPSWRPDLTASNRKHMERFMAAACKIPDVNSASIYVTIDGKRRQFGHGMFRTSREQAPVFHIDGSLTLGALETIVPDRLERGAQPSDLKVAVGTIGYSPDHPGCLSCLMYDQLPPDARPVVDVEFPAAKPGEFLPAQRFTLDGKC
jgi:hypothetical protein